MGGGQIGYNWQYSPLIVVGLEADFQGAAERDSNYLSNPYSFVVPGVSPGTGTSVTDYTTKIEWFGTARVRIGYVWGEWGCDELPDRGASLRQGRFGGNKHSQRDSRDGLLRRRHGLCYQCLQS
jgi:hypothetical protein